MNIKQMLEDARARDCKLYHISNLADLGAPDVSLTSGKLIELQTRAHQAFTNGYFIEFLSIILLELDFWLRVYLNEKGVHSIRGDPLSICSDRHTLGTLIYAAKNNGLDPALFKRLSDFNNVRIDYIHRYTTTPAPYESLAITEPEAFQLIGDLQTLVLQNNEVTRSQL
jgi:hypothetical protein